MSVERAHLGFWSVSVDCLHVERDVFHAAAVGDRDELNHSV